MATLKGIGFNQANARTTTGSTGDTVSFDVQVVPNATGTGLSVTNDAFVGGNLVVTGDITSRSTSQLLVGDQFIDLAVGNNTAVHLPVGYTGQVASANGFTEETSASFTTAGAENGASGSFQITGAFAGATQNIVTQCLTINNNVALTVTFNTGSAVEPTVFTGNSATMGTSGRTTVQTVDALVVLFNSKVDVDGVTSFVVSKTGSDTVTFTSNLGRYVQNNITFTLNNTPPITKTDGTASNNMAKITFGGTTAFRQGDIMAVSQADTATNDGLLGVIHNSGTDAFICTKGAFYPSRLGFLQSDITTDATDTGAKAVCVDLYVQAVSDGVIPISTGASTLGDLLDHFAQDCTFSNFAEYTTVGAGITDLQLAYNNGNQIITASTRDISFVLTSGDFSASTSATGDFLVNGGGIINLTSTNVGTGIALTSSGGELDLTGNSVDINSTSTDINISANTTLDLVSTTTTSISAGTDLSTSVGGNTGLAKYALFSIIQNSGADIDGGRVVKLIPQAQALTQVEIVAGNIVQDDTLTIQTADGVPTNYVLTARNSGAGAQQFNIETGGSASANNNGTAQNIIDKINASPLNADLSAVRTDNVITITQLVAGTTGNGKTCQSSDAGTNGMFKPGASTTQPDNFAGGINRDIQYADNTSAIASTILGIVATDTGTGVVTVVYGGESMIKTVNYTFSVANVGSKVYLGTLGQLTLTPTQVSTEFVIECGIVFDTDTVLFRPVFIMENG